MVSYSYKKAIFSIRHGWFVTDYKTLINKSNADIVMCHAVDESDIHLFDKSSKQATLITDLTLNNDEIFQKINKNYRYEIRRCAKENVVYKVFWGKEILDDPNLFERFISVYNQMYKSKGLKTTFNKTQILSCIESNCIVFSIAFLESEPLVFHSYIYDENDSRFYYSASPFRERKQDAALIARMNKGLHWYDIQLFKSKGIARYDWC